MNKISVLLLLFCLASCKKSEKEINQPPETQFSISEINLSGENRLNSVVHLNWYGKDPDGYVKGYELSYDKQHWDYTTVQDSIFRFRISSNSDTADIDLYVRSIDNEGLVDPTPAFLRIPLKNTPPTVEFDDKLNLPDTVYIVGTTAWTAMDIDGNESIQSAYLKINNGQWHEINKDIRTISILPKNPTISGLGDAYLYYGSDKNPSSVILDGLKVNDTNKVYIKVKDISAAESNIDSSQTFYLKGKNSDVLLIGGINGNPANIYKTTMNHIGVSFDYIDFISNSFANLPRLWNPTFNLLLVQYNKVVFFSDEGIVFNPLTGQSGMLLEFAAPSFQEFANNGGNFLITTDFKTTSNMEPIYGTMPIDTLSESSEFGVRMYPDSSLIPKDSNYSFLQPTSIISGVNSFYPTADAEEFYTAQLTTPTNWTGPKTIASARRKNGKLYQVFFSVELWQYNKSQSDLDALFNRILNVEFN